MTMMEMEFDENDKSVGDEKPNLFCHRFRFFILLLGTLCLTLVFSNVLSMNFTVICMAPPKNATGNISIELVKPVVDNAHPSHAFAEGEKANFQKFVSYSAILATFPFSYFCTKFGARNIFFICGLISAITTALIPLAVNLDIYLPSLAGWSVYSIYFLRFMQGIPYACAFAVIGVLCNRWASLRENAKFIGVLTCFSPLSSVFTNSISGVICDSSLGWPWVHYVHGFVSLVLFTLWFIFYTDSPASNPNVSKVELEKINIGKTQAHRNIEPFVPYFEILKDKLVWTIWLNAFTDLTAAFFLFMYSADYVKKVLKFSTTNTGFVSAIISFSNIPVKLAAAYVSDAYNCMSEKNKLIVFNSIAVFLPGFAYIAICLVPTDYPMVIVALFVLILSSIGFNCGGFYKCAALVTRQYAEFVIAFTQGMKCIVFFIAPSLMTLFVHNDENAQEWHIIFYIFAGSLIFSNIIFCIYATDQPRPFTKITAATGRNLENGKITEKIDLEEMN